MSTVICTKTGITSIVVDGTDMEFILEHPLTRFDIAVSHWTHKARASKSEMQLLAGSIITILVHYNLVKLNNATDAYYANKAMVEQAKHSHQLLRLAQKLGSSSKALEALSHGTRTRAGKLERRQFSLEAANALGTEMHGEERKFLLCLSCWLGEILPPTEAELVHLAEYAKANKPLFDLDIELIETEDGTVISKELVVDAIKNATTDNIVRHARRLPQDKLQKTVKVKIKYVTDLGIFTENQRQKLYTMVSNSEYNKRQIAKAVELVEHAAYKEESNSIKQLKLFNAMGWINAARVVNEAKVSKQARELADGAMDAMEGMDMLTDVVQGIYKSPEMAARERIATLRNRSKV